MRLSDRANDRIWQSLQFRPRHFQIQDGFIGYRRELPVVSVEGFSHEGWTVTVSTQGY